MILSKSEYLDLINSLLPDNSTQQISPLDLRTSFTNAVDSSHLFLVDRDINSLNVATPNIRSTKLGQYSLSGINLPGGYSEDNSAVGYYALGVHRSGERNTSIGSHSLGCSLYGNENVAVGFNALAGNVDGSGNVGVGNHTLQSNRNGDFNIAIGHGAGYYIGNNISNPENNSFKLYIAAHPVDTASLCEIVVNSGNDPLVYGDLKDLKFGIATKTLHNFGTLQVNGATSPTLNSLYDLGHPSYNWKHLYLSSGIAYANSGNFVISVMTPKNQEQYPNQYDSSGVIFLGSGGAIGFGTTTPSGSLGLVTSKGNILPHETSIYSLGTNGLLWDGYFNDVIISGQAIINDLQYNTIEECLYECKTLHLATSGICDGSPIGPLCGYLSDESLDGAGFIVHSSGSDYQRDYKFIYRFPDQGLSCLEQDSTNARARWQSNISIEIESGRHLSTDRVLGNSKLSLVTQSGCHGLFLNNSAARSKTFLSKQDYINGAFPYETDVNFISTSGSSSNYLVSYSSPESGVTVGQRLATRVGGTMTGFGLEYKDEGNITLNGQNKDRLLISSYNGASRIDAITVLRDKVSNSGLVGISDTTGIMPETTLNIQSLTECGVRIASSGANTTKVQLLSYGNTPASGLQISYNPSQNISDIAIFKPMGTTGFQSGILSIHSDGYVGIGSTFENNTRLFTANAPLTISHKGSLSGTIALRSQTVAPSITSNFGKVYVKPYVVGSAQTQSLFFKDDGNNEFNLIFNSNDSDTANLVYVDVRGNTHVGKYSPITRPANVATYNNTSLGYQSLSGITTGDENVSIGSLAGRYLSTSSGNVIIGSNAGSNLESGVLISNNNVIVGKDALKNVAKSVNSIIIGPSNLATNIIDGTNYPTGCIIIGSNLYNNATGVNDYRLTIGHGSEPLIEGYLGGANGRIFNVKDSKLSVSTGTSHDVVVSNDQNATSFSQDVDNRYISNIEIKDKVSPTLCNGAVVFKFTNAIDESKTLLSLHHDASAMSTGTSYSIANPSRPLAELRGDLRIRGALRFSDGSYLESSYGNNITAGTGLIREDNEDSILHLNYTNLISAQTLTGGSLNPASGLIAISVPSGNTRVIGSVSIQTLSDLVGSGFASVSTNCNHVFVNSDAFIDTVNNHSSIFAGCDAGVGATGWKHSIILGSEAGKNATTPNVGLSTDTASTFIGYRAGFNADNVANSIFMGTNAGHSAVSAQRSIFLGASAGQDCSFDDSIGIGQHALRGTPSLETGTGNIEIVAGLLDYQRLMYSGTSISNKLNIGNSIAGDMSQRRMSIGYATLTPDAPLSVKKNDLALSHSATPYVQTWYCNNTRVAAIDCDGFVVQDRPLFVEGYARDQIAAPTNAALPTSGILDLRNSNWALTGSVYITNRDIGLIIPDGAYVVATIVNKTYRPIWVSCT